MARLSRMVIPGAPHHVTQRGNRREPIFFEPGGEAVYLDLMAVQLRRHNAKRMLRSYSTIDILSP